MPRKTAADGSSARAPTTCFNEAAARCRGKRAGRRRRPTATAPCFNEAAARCRGKLAALGAVRRLVGRSFNEAAARCRGKRWTLSFAFGAFSGFNEAAARCRGKQQPRSRTCAGIRWPLQ